jgi:hypothetical protein
MYYQLVKEFINGKNVWKKVIEGTTKRKPKKDVCHSTIILEVMFQKWFPLEEQSHTRKRSKQSSHTRIREERNIWGRGLSKTKTSESYTIFPKKEQQLETRITRRTILMSYSDDEEEKEIL